MPIIDCRYRPSTKETMASVVNNPVYSVYITVTDFCSRPVTSLEACIEELRRLGVEKAVITGRDCESTVAVPHTNDDVLACIRTDKDLFIGFYGYDPHKGMTSWHSMRSAIAQGMSGASIEPCMAKCCVADARYYPLYALCCDYDIPVSITAGLSPHMPGVTLDPMAPWHVDKVAADFPDLRILISHGCYPWVNEAIAVCMRHRNVFMDFSTCDGKPLGELYIKAANEHIGDRVVFSSANPFIEVAKAVQRYEALEFHPTIRQKIMYDNAARLLRL